MESAEQPTIQLHQKLGENLKALGQEIDTVPAHEQPVLSKELKGLIPERVEEFFSGKDIHTHVGVTPGGRWNRVINKIRSIKEGFRRK